MAEPSGCLYDPNRGYAIHTYSGKAFYPKDIRPEDVTLVDIAHGLAMICRYGGQADTFFSVAEHSVNCFDQAVAMNLSVELCREALFHDAVESYMGFDPARPYKLMVPGITDFEKMIETQLHPILKIPHTKSKQIKYIDELMLATELPLLFQQHNTFIWVSQLGRYVYTGNESIQEGLPTRLEWHELNHWMPKEAESEFWVRVEKLRGMENAV